MRAQFLAHLRRNLVRGLLLVLPLLITLWLLSLLFNLVDVYITPWVVRLLEWSGVAGIEDWARSRVLIPLIGLILSGLLIYALGVMGGNLIGRRIVAAVESYILRVPLVKGVYGSARQLLNAFSLTGKKAFSKVVLLEYPRRGLWTIGFVTSEVEQELRGSREMTRVATVPVFLPTTPNPTSGWMLLVPTEDLLVLDMTIDEAVKLIVSGGIVSPVNLGGLIREWRAGPELPVAGD